MVADMKAEEFQAIIALIHQEINKLGDRQEKILTDISLLHERVIEIRLKLAQIEKSLPYHSTPS